MKPGTLCEMTEDDTSDSVDPGPNSFAITLMGGPVNKGELVIFIERLKTRPALVKILSGQGVGHVWYEFLKRAK